jgi:hypothetical protein
VGQTVLKTEDPSECTVVWYKEETPQTHIEFWYGNMKGKGDIRDLGVRGMIILKLMLSK